VAHLCCAPVPTPERGARLGIILGLSPLSLRESVPRVPFATQAAKRTRDTAGALSLYLPYGTLHQHQPDGVETNVLYAVLRMGANSGQREWLSRRMVGP
jgi:hypothetical protein